VPRRDCDVAEHELRIQPIAAFLEVTAIRELRKQVGGSEQMADDAVFWVVELDLIEAHLVAGEVHDRGLRSAQSRPGRCAADSPRETPLRSRVKA
jgi:hypothetical protein